MQSAYDILEGLSDATVAIKRREGELLGTGVVVTEGGLILTCYHIIEDRKDGINNSRILDVYFSKGKITIPAEILEEYCDPHLDIALLKLRIT